MKRYLIKATFTGGAHKGETYYIRKGGYVTNDPRLCCAEDFYTEASAKAVATKWNKENEFYQSYVPSIEPTKYEAAEVA